MVPGGENGICVESKGDETTQTPYDRLRTKWAAEDGVSETKTLQRCPDWRLDLVKVADFSTWEAWMKSVT